VVVAGLGSREDVFLRQVALCWPHHNIDARDANPARDNSQNFDHCLVALAVNPHALLCTVKTAILPLRFLHESRAARLAVCHFKGRRKRTDSRRKNFHRQASDHRHQHSTKQANR